MASEIIMIILIMYFADYVPRSHKDAKQCWKDINKREEDFHLS